MSRVIQIFIIPMILLIILGCASKPKIVYVKTSVVKPIYVPDTLLKDDIELPVPPERHVFIKTTPLRRETLLVNHILDLYKVIGKYKLKLKAVRDYNKAIKKKIDSHE